MNCDGCSACCRVIACAFETKTPAEAAELRAFVQVRGGKIIGKLLIFPSACPFLDVQNNRCLIYATRPEVCKKFPVGGEDCQSCRAYQQ